MELLPQNNLSLKFSYLNYFETSSFVGYNQLKIETEVIGVFDEGIVLKETPFYAESGGQLSDQGVINGIQIARVKKLPNGQSLHVCETDTFQVGDHAIAIVDEKLRLQTERNHSSAHLFHQAIKEILGEHAIQQGQQVNAKRIR